MRGPAPAAATGGALSARRLWAMLFYASERPNSRSRLRGDRRGLPLGLRALGDQREDVVARDRLAVLVRHLDVPCDHAVAAPLRVFLVAVDLALACQARA